MIKSTKLEIEMNIIFLLVITFTTADGYVRVAHDTNPHATLESCQAKVDHLRPTAPKNWQHVEFECKKYPAPRLEINDGAPTLGPNTKNETPALQA